jgi:hypothetical protein
MRPITRLALLAILVIASGHANARKKPPHPETGGNQRPANGVWLSPTDTECQVRLWRICIVR